MPSCVPLSSALSGRVPREGPEPLSTVLLGPPHGPPRREFFPAQVDVLGQLWTLALARERTGSGNKHHRVTEGQTPAPRLGGLPPRPRGKDTPRALTSSGPCPAHVPHCPQPPSPPLHHGAVPRAPLQGLWTLFQQWGTELAAATAAFAGT